MRDTKERLLDAAEALFSRDGMEATSMRSITAAAEANLAAVNYHFGSKEALTEAVFSRRLVPINAERLELVSRAEENDPLELEAVLDAFVGPPLRRMYDPEFESFIRLMGRMYSHPSEALKELIGRQFGEVVARFTAAFQRAVPELSLTDTHWRLHFTVGAMVHVISDPVLIQRLSGGLCEPDDVEGTIRRMIEFFAAGFRVGGEKTER